VCEDGEGKPEQPTLSILGGEGSNENGDLPSSVLGGNPMKFCKDCKWYQADEFMGRCGQKESKHTDPVTGEEKFYYAQLQRFGITGCGMEGKYWEAKS
jgi:hypothetical protein